MSSRPKPGRMVVMAILNVTPDSFSDGGRYLSTAAAVAHGRDLLARGADIIDVGGESTRPGAPRVPLEQELARVVPVVDELVRAGATVSVDTMRAKVAAATVRVGATIINDVSGGLADAAMLDTVAALGVGYVAMHWRAHSDRMQASATYADVVAEVTTELAGRRDAALAAGILPDDLVLDPGLGFAKEAEHNWLLLAGLDAISALGHDVLVGASRKRFLGSLLADAEGPRPPAGRDEATAALSALLAARGIWGVRTHTVEANLDAARVASALRTAAETLR